ncbi:conserved phage C-terminal domain-containing protein [Romboutsia sedimentorum]|uniref:Conserved phage C-terminal domain-containing protein n=1 Tax=Romboutsia sedimentorum TaxID=1368474 RepID=A0ABT7E7P1_9FIRM|nr:conserved phage C-terminal domain-containing protein [Romboutsia sedimentorum]MDK2562950.1 conserved phage C-terminal domain-containing protein [Romboutsia sedimentorum]
MGYCFNKMNTKVLKFDIDKDIDRIRFNHYVMRRENLNRIKNEFPKNQFSLTVSTVMKDLSLSHGKAQRMISEFEKLGIIKSISKASCARGYSIYEYITNDDWKYDKDSGIEHDIGYDIAKDSNCNIDETDSGNVIEVKSGMDIDNSKKENTKRELNKENIYGVVVDYLNKKTNKNFKATTQKTKSFINARLKEGFCEKDFYNVIDIKVSQWMYTDMQKFLRPETLFSNKFEGYLNEVVIKSEETSEIWDIKFDF